jgi:hypothetical protein
MSEKSNKYWEYEEVTMKKIVFLRGLLGFPLGIAVGYFITIFVSISLGTGQYSPCVPQLTETVGSEVGAVALQAVLCGLIGASFAACSAIWEIEKWSIVKQTGIYFLITLLVMMPIAYFLNWMEHTVVGFLIYLGVFVVIFVLTWAVQYLIWRRKINQMNEKLKK